MVHCVFEDGHVAIDLLEVHPTHCRMLLGLVNVAEWTSNYVKHVCSAARRYLMKGNQFRSNTSVFLGVSHTIHHGDGDQTKSGRMISTYHFAAVA